MATRGRDSDETPYLVMAWFTKINIPPRSGYSTARQMARVSFALGCCSPTFGSLLFVVLASIFEITQ